MTFNGCNYEDQGKLFGTFGKDIPEYEPATGFEIEIPENATVDELFRHLKIVGSQMAFVAINGKILKPDDVLQGGDAVHVFQSVFGG